MNPLGTSPSQIPTNGDLGTLAWHDASSVNIGGGVVYANNNTASTYYNDTDVSIVNPTLNFDFVNNTNLDSRITFTRAGTGTYYDGKSSVVAEQNLIIYSQQFDNSNWSKTGMSLVANTTIAPDGTLTGSTLSHTGSGSVDKLSIGIVGGGRIFLPATISLYVKAGSSNYIGISPENSGAYYAVDLSTASATYTAAPSTGTITSVGNGWYRITLYTPTSYVGLIIVTSDAPITTQAYSSGSGSVYIWGAQLEQRSANTIYTPTTSSTITNYIPQLKTAANNVPRFDYDPITGENKGLFIEPASTNVLLYSSDFTIANWIKTQCTITPAAAVSPDGTLNASLLVLNSTSILHQLTYSAPYTPTIYTNSVYLKYYGQQFVQLNANINGNMYCNFDLINGITGTAAGGSGSPVGSIQSVGNGWYRCSLSFTSTITSGANFGISPSYSLSTTYQPIFAGNGFSGYLIWGAQVEAKQRATSYIPTSGSQVTRAADYFGIANTGWHNYGEFTLCCEFNTTSPTIDSTFGFFGLYYGAITNLNAYAWTMYNNFMFLSNGNTSPALGYQQGLNRIAISVDQYGRYAVKNGGSVASNLTPLLSVYSNPTYAITYLLAMGSSATGYIRSIKYYPKRLSDLELTEITKLT